MIDELTPLFQLTPKNPKVFAEKEYEAYLYLHGVYMGPWEDYCMEEQYEKDIAIIRSTKHNQSPITTFYNQGCIQVRFYPRENLQKEGNQIQFLFKFKQMDQEDTTPIQIYLFNHLVKEEQFDAKKKAESISFISDIPMEGYLEIFVRPYAKEEISAMIFDGLITYLHD
ncbi:MAG: hypothetical protein FK732_07430 [Asgard group archaeon]|nr:hypothetical protein [Asgard group archaeon]